MPTPRFHYLRYRAFCYPSEDVERVVGALKRIVGDVEPAREGFQSHHGATQYLLEGEIKRSQEIKAIVKDWPQGLEASYILPRLETLVDEDGILQVRFQKQQAALGNVKPGPFEDAIVVQLRPMVHPSSREACLELLRTWLTEPDEAEATSDS